MLFASWQVSLTTNIIKAANSYVLLAVAAAVIGGTSLFGGRGKTIHGVLGGLVIGAIYNGLYLLGVSSQWIDVVVAAVLIAAAIIDVLSRRGAPTTPDLGHSGSSRSPDRRRRASAARLRRSCWSRDGAHRPAAPSVTRQGAGYLIPA